jgi:hypothetical protein
MLVEVDHSWTIFLLVALVGSSFARRVFLCLGWGQRMDDPSPTPPGPTTVSGTDEGLFFALSNPDHVERSAWHPVRDDHAGPSPSSASAIFAPARRREHAEVVPSPMRPPSLEASPVGGSPHSSVRERVAERLRQRGADASPVPSPALSCASRDSRRSRRSRDSRDSHRSRDSRRSRRPGYYDDDEETRMEKTNALLDLARMREAGVAVTREYTMADRLEDMHFELRRHAAARREKVQVKSLRGKIRMGSTAIEFANKRWGPFLRLDGWSDRIKSDMDADLYDEPLAKLYRKWGAPQHETSPEVELAWLVLGSMGMCHFQHMMREWGDKGDDAVEAPAPAAPADFGPFAAEPAAHEGLPPEPADPAPVAPQRRMAPPE